MVHGMKTAAKYENKKRKQEKFGSGQVNTVFTWVDPSRTLFFYSALTIAPFTVHFFLLTESLE